MILANRWEDIALGRLTKNEEKNLGIQRFGIESENLNQRTLFFIMLSIGEQSHFSNLDMEAQSKFKGTNDILNQDKGTFRAK